MSMLRNRRVLFTVILAGMALVLPSPRGARAGLVTGTFEDQNPGPDTFNNDFSSTNSFMTGGFTLNNNFEQFPAFSFWSGFSVSSSLDNTFVKNDSDFSHEYGAYAPLGANGTGSGGSATYGVADNFSQGDAIINLPAGTTPFSIDITNSTYAADSIVFGDSFTGGPFVQGDFFRLDILGYSDMNGGGTQVGDIPFYLADFRGSSLLLVSNWTTVDLSSLIGAESLEFTMTSTNSGMNGINTPAFFAIDNIVAQTADAAVPEPSTIVLGAIGLGMIGGYSLVRRGRASKGR